MSEVERYTNATEGTVVIRGEGLTLDEACAVAHGRARAEITSDVGVLARVAEAHARVQKALSDGEIIYGVTTGFGGMAHILISANEIDALQSNMLWSHKAGLGRALPRSDVRAAMLLRANSLLRGASGIRLQLVERLEIFLNEHVTPCVPEMGSIGASGDLVPLAYIAGALVGHEAGYKVEVGEEELPAPVALKRLGLSPLPLQAKEALALLNGTSVMAGIAANCVHDARDLLVMALHVHALFVQGLCGTNLSFHRFIHEHKPHSGQVWVADAIWRLLEGSTMVREGGEGRDRNARSGPVQDRYSLRCIAQYLGPVADGIKRIAGDVETEMNSANDNPLIDVQTGGIYYGGNFLGEYIGVGMDQLRYYLGLVAKHLDVQIAMLASPEFSNGLAPSLVGNVGRRVNMGLKGLQIAGNSIMPLICFLGNSLADRYPTHAEQYNQNINSQGFGSANLARQSLELMRQYLAICLVFAVQAVDLRSKLLHDTYDARKSLSPMSLPLYLAVRELTCRPANPGRPWMWDDDEHHLDIQVSKLARSLGPFGPLVKAAEGSVHL